MNDEPLKPQTTLRDYVIKRVLGRGSFGVTYLAEDTNRHVTVAIKEYFPLQIAKRGDDGSTVDSTRFGALGPDFHEGLQKFLEESRTLAGFESPHIVQVVDTFEHNGTAYMVMQYEEGGTLARYLESHQEPLKEAQILSIFIPLLEGLKTIHAKWVLHRDIKPDNIYIRKDDSPLLIDFGTARHALSAKQGGMTEYLTPGYAPPEQYDRHGDHGPWTDIYAVGSSIYYCMTRITPYEGRFRTPDKDPVVSAIQAAPAMYRRQLLEIVDWMMNPSHKDRPQSVEDVLLRLIRLRDEEPESVAGAEASLARNMTQVVENKKTTTPDETPQVRLATPKSEAAQATTPSTWKTTPSQVPEDPPRTKVTPRPPVDSSQTEVHVQTIEAWKPPWMAIVSAAMALLVATAAAFWLIPSKPEPMVEPKSITKPQLEEPQSIVKPELEDQQTKVERGLIREAQILLKELDYYRGRADGIDGIETRKAVQQAQKHLVSTQDGKVSRQLVSQLQTLLDERSELKTQAKDQTYSGVESVQEPDVQEGVQTEAKPEAETTSMVSEDATTPEQNANEDWKQAVKGDTLEAYRQFLREHPDSRYNSLAKTKLEILERDFWKQANEKNTKEAYENFTVMFPDSKFTRLARLRSEKL